LFTVVKRFQEYVEPDESGKKKRHTQANDQALPPIADGVLTENFGVPIIVACCKVRTSQLCS